MNSRYTLLLVLFFATSVTLMAQKPVQGRRTNLVCLVHFADESPSMFRKSANEYIAYFNDSTQLSAASLNNFYRHQSFGRFNVVSEFPFTTPEGATQIIAYKDSHNRKYYEAKIPFLNQEGYDTDLGAGSRERQLVRDVSKWLDERLPSDLLLDADGNDSVDNLFLVVSGTQSKNSVILYPHQGLQILLADYIKGKRVGAYTILFDDPLDLGTTCHEFMHTLGAPDLYLSNKALPRPIGTWDLMATNGLSPQGMSAYTRYRYGGWLPEPKELTEAGFYELSPLMLNAPGDVWYKIQEAGREEFFVLEFRSKSDVFDKTLPSSGLLIYRINPRVTGNNSSNGTSSPYGQYVFRSGGTPTSEGTLLFAALSAETGRTTFAAGQSIYPFYSDGSLAQFEITQVDSAANEKMRFHYQSIAASTPVMKEVHMRCMVDGHSRTLVVQSPSAIASLTLYDAGGRQVSRHEAPAEQRFSLSHLQRGMYIVKMITINNEYYSDKIIL